MSEKLNLNKREGLEKVSLKQKAKGHFNSIKNLIPDKNVRENSTKRIKNLLYVLPLIFSLESCGNSSNQNPNNPNLSPKSPSVENITPSLSSQARSLEQKPSAKTTEPLTSESTEQEFFNLPSNSPSAEQRAAAFDLKNQKKIKRGISRSEFEKIVNAKVYSRMQEYFKKIAEEGPVGTPSEEITKADIEAQRLYKIKQVEVVKEVRKELEEIYSVDPKSKK